MTSQCDWSSDVCSSDLFNVILSAPVNATIAKASGAVTILNDDGAPTLSISDVSVIEGNRSEERRVGKERMSARRALTISVDWTTANGSALTPADYLAGSGTLTFVL